MRQWSFAFEDAEFLVLFFAVPSIMRHSYGNGGLSPRWDYSFFGEYNSESTNFLCFGMSRYPSSRAYSHSVIGQVPLQAVVLLEPVDTQNKTGKVGCDQDFSGDGSIPRLSNPH